MVRTSETGEENIHRRPIGIVFRNGGVVQGTDLLIAFLVDEVVVGACDANAARNEPFPRLGDVDR
jgi:hypothetical protein